MEKIERIKQIHYPAYKWEKLNQMKKTVSEATGKPDPSIPDVVDFLVAYWEMGNS